ncbi:hypothetical protein [Bradyrhizobium sp.]|uniref:hypothetical protein n=1 Tax=Bradyrhizobium sp. TaxID=376 RepID=UPI003C1663D5
MAKRRKSVPMETQPGRDEAATPMAQASSERGQVQQTPASKMPRSQAETARKRSLKKQRSMQHE